MLQQNTLVMPKPLTMTSIITDSYAGHHHALMMILPLINMVIHALHGMMMIAQVVVSTMSMISYQLMHVAHVEVDLNQEVAPSQETHALTMKLSLIRRIIHAL